ncbi:hypothetical protein HNQ96_003076 [Aminobacter lissarensis]|uniref:Uncharacterized protein n=1 Tax=Aminobacter carboxidus TaxID=376165 RepID=A0A8E2BDW9_9HYPH|nr:hypothetical protein [Aminobacter lissarensis]
MRPRPCSGFERFDELLAENAAPPNADAYLKSAPDYRAA